MGKNKLSKFADMAEFQHVFQVSSHYLREGNIFELSGKWNSAFFGNNHPIVLELGCGKGEYTVELAKMYPEKNFIGIDIKGARIWTGAKKALEQQLPNVAFLRTDIEMVHHCFGAAEVSEIWLTFPDPQMKKTTKRLTATNFMRNYRQFMMPNGLIHLKTDSFFMYTYTCEMVKTNGFEIVSQNDDIYATIINNPALKIKTHYEQQWLERGLTIKYISFKLPNCDTFIEPDVEIEHDTYRSYGRSKQHHVSAEN